MKKYLVISLLLTSRLAYTANPDDLTLEELAAIAQSEQQEQEQKERAERMFYEQEHAKRERLQRAHDQEISNPTMTRLQNMSEVDRNKFLYGLYEDDRQHFFNLLPESQQDSYVLFESLQYEQQRQTAEQEIMEQIKQAEQQEAEEQQYRQRERDEALSNFAEIVRNMPEAERNNYLYNLDENEINNFINLLNQDQIDSYVFFKSLKDEQQRQAAGQAAEQEIMEQIEQAEKQELEQRKRANRMYREQEKATWLERLQREHDEALSNLTKVLRNMSENERNNYLYNLDENKRIKILHLLQKEQLNSYLNFRSLQDKQQRKSPDISSPYSSLSELSEDENNYDYITKSSMAQDIEDFDHLTKKITLNDRKKDPFLEILYQYAMALWAEFDESAFLIFKIQVKDYDFTQLETIEDGVAKEHIVRYITSLKDIDYQKLSLFAHLEKTSIQKILMLYYLATGSLRPNSEKDTIANILTFYIVTHPRMVQDSAIGREAEEKLRTIIMDEHNKNMQKNTPAPTHPTVEQPAILQPAAAAARPAIFPQKNKKYSTTLIHDNNGLPVVASTADYAMFTPLAAYATHVGLQTQTPGTYLLNWSKTPELDNDTQILITNYIPHLHQNDFNHLMALAHMKYTTPEYILAEYYKATGNLNHSVPVSTVLQQYVDTHPDRLQYSDRTIELEKDVHASNQQQQSLTSKVVTNLLRWWNNE